MIRIKNLHKSFGSLEVLKGVDLHITPGEVVVVIGPSGSGKSTLLRCINCLEEITSGTIIVDGFDVVLFRLFVGGLTGQVVYCCLNAVEGEIRVDRLCAVSTEQAEIMNLSGLAGLNDEPHLGSQTSVNQVVVDRRGCEQ